MAESISVVSRRYPVILAGAFVRKSVILNCAENRCTGAVKSTVRRRSNGATCLIIFSVRRSKPARCSE